MDNKLEDIEFPEELLTALEDLSLDILDTYEVVQAVAGAATLERIPNELPPRKTRHH